VVDRMQNFHKGIKGVCIAPVMAPIVRATYTQDHQRLMHFADVVATGMAEGGGDSPAVVLRNWLIAGREKGLSSRIYGDRNGIYKKTTIALLAYIKGETIQHLNRRDIEEEAFPIPHDVKIKKEEEAK